VVKAEMQEQTDVFAQEPRKKHEISYFVTPIAIGKTAF
jgi:hypothetical protein